MVADAITAVALPQSSLQQFIWWGVQGRVCGVQASGIWGELATLKKVVTEPKGTGEAFDTVMKDYYGAIKKGRGGLFMAVCRGKVTSSTLHVHHANISHHPEANQSAM